MGVAEADSIVQLDQLMSCKNVPLPASQMHDVTSRLAAAAPASHCKCNVMGLNTTQRQTVEQLPANSPGTLRICRRRLGNYVGQF